MSVEFLDAVFREWQELHKPKQFVPGKTYIPASGKTIGFEEAFAACSTIMLGHWTDGDITVMFEKELQRLCWRSGATFVNSGSSANELAFDYLFEDIEKGEIITSAVGFPTTIAPIVRHGFTPVFVDVELDYYNPSFQQIKDAVTSNTRGIVMASTLGNPLPASNIQLLCNELHIPFLHDCCDAFMSYQDQIPVTAYGSMATLSFYPAHFATTAEGGAVLHNSGNDRLIKRKRDWGRGCWCKTGRDNTCNQRFSFKVDGALFDHKYMIEELGYNFKATDIQAAIGLEQLRRVDDFVTKRQYNWTTLWTELRNLDWLATAKIHDFDSPCWFGFPVRVLPGWKMPFTKYLEEHMIGTRPVFGGNLTRQPFMKKQGMIIPEPLVNSNIVMEDCLWIGCWPGIDDQMLEYMIKTVKEFENVYPK